MVDPSILFSEAGIAWLQDDGTARDGIVVAATVMRWLRGEIDLNRRGFVAPEDLEMIDQRREQLLSVLDGVSSFSYEGADLSPEHDAVLRNLLEVPGQPPFASRGIYADEWAFLQSQSSLIAKLRNPVDAFRDAGSAVVEFGREVGQQLIRKVIKPEHVPRVLTPKLIAKVTAKWIVVGGAAVGGGTLGGIIGTVIGGPIGGAYGGKVGGFAATSFTGAAILAIDP
jgi:hypothetical protein